MSHLTAPMPSGHRAQRSYLVDFPRPAHPLTPPDTDYEALAQQAPPPAQTMAGLETESFPPQQPPSTLDSPFASHHRKRPSFTYLNTGPREARDRVVQRGLRWLVVVIPPLSFAREHGHLGHTLSSGPTRRLSSGLLMPLYPTLNSQLGAIAREFSFPSISGICVYLHTTHGGLSLSPRVSDESWPVLWAHLFEARSPSLPLQQLPISGQIEFDIDLSKARWYDSWLSSSRREYADVPQSVTPSRAPSMSHWRAESQTSINEPLDDQTDTISVVQPARASSRNIKKLSLLDRLDGPSARPGSKLVPRDESPPSQTTRQVPVIQSLSPIVQEDEPATAKKYFDNRVQSWRMSATAAVRSPLAATGQTSLDPANMPNTMPDLPTASTSEFRSELNLDDYTWSVSSAGPPDYDSELESLVSWDRVPSVHMDRRMEGSVCLTPSICTSFGPDDEYFPFSPVSYASRLPSPDLAWRMLDDAPRTPSTATSWGAPLSYPPSPELSAYAPSIDLGARCLSSRPVTPTTATSWGAPLSYPPSPVMSSRAPSPDLGERGMSSVPGSPSFRRSPPAPQPYTLVYPYYNAEKASTSQHVFPYYDAGKVSTWQHVWPYNDSSKGEAATWKQVWPYSDAARASTWQHVWPYVQVADAAATGNEERAEAARMEGFVFPPPVAHTEEGPWNQVWPYNAPSPESSAEAGPWRQVWPYTAPSPKLDGAETGPWEHVWPYTVPPYGSSADRGPWKQVWPYMCPVTTSGDQGIQTVSTALGYPVLDIYPAVYPSFDIYPSLLTLDDHKLSTPAVVTGATYPLFDLYPAVYPSFNIYPAGVSVTGPDTKVVSMRLSASYPNVEPYPPVYPYLTIYPAVSNGFNGSIATVSVIARSSLSSVLVCVASQYPVFNIYPSVNNNSATRTTPVINVQLKALYPTFDIYPAVYPYSLDHVYPSVSAKPISKVGSRSVSVGVQFHYPVFDIYPSMTTRTVKSSTRSSIPIALSKAYPAFDIYPAVYPWNLQEIYPEVSHSKARVDDGVMVKLVPQYLVLDIYPAVYPHNLAWIYPGRSASSTLSARTGPAGATKPSLSLRPSARPSVRTHSRKASLKRGVAPPVPPLPKNARDLTPFSPISRHPLPLGRVGAPVSVHLSAAYPSVCPYPPVYPYLSIYPAVSAGIEATIEVGQIRMTPAVPHGQYPYLVIYPSVYPHIEIYPGSWDHSPALSRVPHQGVVRGLPKFTHMELRAQVHSAVPFPAATPVAARRKPKFTHQELHEQVLAAVQPARQRPTFSHLDLRKQVLTEHSPVELGLPMVVVAEPSPVMSSPASSSLATPSPITPEAFSPPAPEFELVTTIAPSPAPARASAPVPEPFSPPEPDFEIIIAPAPAPAATARRVSFAPAPPTHSRTRSGTVSSRPPAPPPSRPAGARPPAPSSTVASGGSSPSRTLHRLSGLPSHPAAHRRISSAAAPRPLSTFGPLPAVPEPGAGPAPVRRQQTMMNPVEERRSPMRGTPQLSSPPDDVQRSYRTPTDASPVSRFPGVNGSLSRSNTMPSRAAAPRGPRSSALITERAKLFNTTNSGAAGDESPTKLMMSTLSEFPTPPRPSIPAGGARASVAKLDRSKYPFA
ncbi:hypothetical protein BD413DRAFT_550056 [Trametes elegans]|nr:hypothetical protein BD413DRAFT_550056 [Trametes elegans]